MLYDRYSDTKNIILFGHMCNIKFESKHFVDFFNFVKENRINASLTCTLEGRYYYVSFFSSSVSDSEKIYDILSTWNP